MPRIKIPEGFRSDSAIDMFCLYLATVKRQHLCRGKAGKKDREIFTKYLTDRKFLERYLELYKYTERHMERLIMAALHYQITLPLNIEEMIKVCDNATRPSYTTVDYVCRILDPELEWYDMEHWVVHAEACSNKIVDCGIVGLSYAALTVSEILYGKYLSKRFAIYGNYDDSEALSGDKTLILASYLLWASMYTHNAKVELEISHYREIITLLLNMEGSPARQTVSWATARHLLARFSRFGGDAFVETIEALSPETRTKWLKCLHQSTPFKQNYTERREERDDDL